VGSESCYGVDHDDQKRGADGDGHREAEQQHQRRDDQEAAADAEESGEESDDDTGPDRLR